MEGFRKWPFLWSCSPGQAGMCWLYVCLVIKDLKVIFKCLEKVVCVCVCVFLCLCAFLCISVCLYLCVFVCMCLLHPHGFVLMPCSPSYHFSELRVIRAKARRVPARIRRILFPPEACHPHITGKLSSTVKALCQKTSSDETKAHGNPGKPFSETPR